MGTGAEMVATRHRRRWIIDINVTRCRGTASLYRGYWGPRYGEVITIR